MYSIPKNFIRTIASLAILLAAAATVAPLRAADDPKGNDPVVAAGNDLALDLYGQLKSQPGNLFCSPYSISTALAMTYAGARGDTNALWVQKGQPLLAEFTGTVTGTYEAGLQELDFQQNAEAARGTINSWVEKRTNDKIKDLLKPGLLTADTRLVLTNAIYFKSAWQEPFKKEKTQNAPFTKLDGTKVDVPLMHQTRHCDYVQGASFQAVELPYAGQDLSMIVMLPDRVDGLGDLEQKLSKESLAGWLEGLVWRRVILSLPRFKATSEFRLKPTLSKLGMSQAFTSDADFSGIDGKKGLYLQDVVHKAFVDVNEEGTEAAAATGTALAGAALETKPPAIFRADHPFLYLIRENHTGSILFIGRLTEPQRE
ncbi:MAG: serpin family protein [Planctomycetia bacterium]|nr:serpin family protein [Planctomycetia bacterium]